MTCPEQLLSIWAAGNFYFITSSCYPPHEYREVSKIIMTELSELILRVGEEVSIICTSSFDMAVIARMLTQ
jgi:hypothetical protein